MSKAKAADVSQMKDTYQSKAERGIVMATTQTRSKNDTGQGEKSNPNTHKMTGKEAWHNIARRADAGDRATGRGRSREDMEAWAMTCHALLALDDPPKKPPKKPPTHCQSCGESIQAARFCPNCGKKVEVESE